MYEYTRECGIYLLTTLIVPINQKTIRFAGSLFLQLIKKIILNHHKTIYDFHVSLGGFMIHSIPRIILLASNVFGE
jgi:hypothetical protein